MERTVNHREVYPWWDQMHRVGPGLHAADDHVDRHRCVARQQFGHHRLVIGRQVLNHHERHPGVRTRGGEEMLECLKPAC